MCETFVPSWFLIHPCTFVGSSLGLGLVKSPPFFFDLCAWQFDEVLGKGAFKTVHKAYDSLEGCEVAWNTVQLVGVPEDEKKRIINEVLKMMSTHPGRSG